jgi:hypothetical protein
MPTNDWTIGLQYDPKWNNIAWSQDGGVGTKVYPQQVTGNSNILSIEPFNELDGVYILGCGHSINEALIFRDWDYDTGMSVALICCSICTYIQSRVEPYELALTNDLQYAILFPGISS